MRVILAEKPSVAKTIAAELGANTTKDGYYEGNGYQVTWALGHLVSLCDMEYYLGHIPEKGDLPLFPDKFQRQITVDRKSREHTALCKKRFTAIKQLFNAPGVDLIISATDPDREGEAIFRYIYHHANCKVPFKRFWSASLTSEAIKNAMQGLRDSQEFDPLYDSAKSRNEADWVIGMNASRAISISQCSNLSLGRVQTPTLRMICETYHKNKDFKPEPYYVVKVEFLSPSGMKFSGLFPGQYKTKAEALHFMSKIGEEAIVENREQKEITEKSPLPFDLTSLQIEANKRFGLGADTVSAIAQNLYEEKKTTYPRTDSRYLSKDMKDEVIGNLPKLAKLEFNGDFAANCQTITPANANMAVFNNDEVGGHTAIIPTFINVSRDSKDFKDENHRKIYEMVVRNLVASLMPPCIKTRLTYTLNISGNTLTVSGTTIKSSGWRSVIGNTEPTEGEEEDMPVPEMSKGDSCMITDKTVLDKETKRPPLLTEASLLRMMESAGKLIKDNEELSRAIKEGGIGTPATRAGIIKTLIDERKFVERKGKNLIPTARGLEVFDAVKDMSISRIEMTGELESKLYKISERKYTQSALAEEIRQVTTTIVNELLSLPKGRIQGKNIIGHCPVCGGEIKQGKNTYFCSNYSKEETGCKFYIPIESKGGKISEANVKLLLEGKVTTDIKCKTEDGETYTRRFQLNPNNNYKFGPEIKETVRTSLTCPLCGKGVIATDNYFNCEDYKYKDETSCQFHIFRTFSGLTITERLLSRLLSGEKSEEVELKSKEGKPYKSQLVYSPDTIKIERAEREVEETGLLCPKCGAPIVKNGDYYQCSKKVYKDATSCQFSCYKVKGDTEITLELLKQIITEGSSGPLKGTKGGEYRLVLNEDKTQIAFEYPQRTVETTGLKCPKCGNDIIDAGKTYRCIKHNYKDPKTCSFSIFKTLYGSDIPIPLDVFKDLLMNGTTNRTVPGLEVKLTLTEKGFKLEK